MLLLPLRYPSAQPSILQLVQPSLLTLLPSSQISLPLLIPSPQTWFLHTPATQILLLLLQLVPSATTVWAHPACALVQESVVQALLSSQFTVPEHVPLAGLHLSLVVQALPSLQVSELPVCVQPFTALQPEFKFHRPLVAAKRRDGLVKHTAHVMTVRNVSARSHTRAGIYVTRKMRFITRSVVIRSRTCRQMRIARRGPRPKPTRNQ